MPRRFHHVPALDGVRAVAVALVIVLHAVQPARFAGFAGVDVFFVLSGLLITSILLDEQGAEGRIGLARFYGRRMLRLYPALLTMVALVGAAVVVLHERGGYTRASVLSVLYVSNLWMTAHHALLGPLSHTWSLAQEEQFYLLWPPVLIVLLWRRVSARRIAVGLMVAAVASSVFGVVTYSATVVSFNPLARAGGLLIGCACGVLLMRLRTAHGWAYRHGKRLAASGALIIVAAIAAGTASASMTRYTSAVTNLGAAALIVALVARDDLRVGTWLSYAPMRYVGRISYGLYLWHFPLLILLAGRGWHRPAVAAVGVPVAFVAAALSHRLVERPFLRLKKRLAHAPAVESSSPSNSRISAEHSFVSS